VDLEDLRTFLTIHRTGSFSGAAAALHRTQPAISRRVALLEEELGVPLFERAPGAVMLSQAGLVLLPHAEKTLAAIEDATSALMALCSGIAGPVSVAIVGTLAGANLTPVLQRFAAKHPGVALSLRTATSTEVSDLVRRGEANIGLRYHPDISPDLDSTPVASETLQVVCAPRHRFAGRVVQSLRDLASEHWLAFPDAPELREVSAGSLFAQFQVRGIAELRWTAVDSLTAQKRLVEAGFGLALLPESAIVEEVARGTLALIRVGDLTAANPVHLVTRRRGYLSPAAEALIALLRSSAFAGPAVPQRRTRAKRR